jgi:hypothetical protein
MVLGVVREVFSGKIRLEDAVRMYRIPRCLVVCRYHDLMEVLLRVRDEIYKPGSVQLGSRDH